VGIEVEHAVPILPSRDLRETLEFYAHLGFENRGPPPEDWNYLILGRGGVELQFVAAPGVDLSTTSASCYIRTVDADALHDEWQQLGVFYEAATGSRLVPPTDTPYGMREFAMVDPSGNLIRVGSPLAG
jgi:catechol 2,3-dioxygenase-like lactoylglutathione lyase family enzyme